MNRREFLRMLGLGAAAAATPRLIFDMGKNSHIYTPEVWWGLDLAYDYPPIGSAVLGFPNARIDERFSDLARAMIEKYEFELAMKHKLSQLLSTVNR